MEHGGGHDVGAHKIGVFLGMTFHLDTLIMTWITMALVALFVIGCTRRLALVPGVAQNIVEMVLEPIMSQIEGVMGKKGERVAPIILTIFLFVLFSNYIGLIPQMVSPTADINTTAGLALMVILLVHIFGVMDSGTKYLKHFFTPHPLFVLLHILENCTRPLTMAFRLFGNIISHEILFMIMMILAPFLAPIGVLFLGLFIGTIQAAIFTILSITYIAGAFLDENH